MPGAICSSSQTEEIWVLDNRPLPSIGTPTGFIALPIKKFPTFSPSLVRVFLNCCLGVSFASSSIKTSTKSRLIELTHPLAP